MSRRHRKAITFRRRETADAVRRAAAGENLSVSAYIAREALRCARYINSREEGTEDAGTAETVETYFRDTDALQEIEQAASHDMRSLSAFVEKHVGRKAVRTVAAGE